MKRTEDELIEAAQNLLVESVQQVGADNTHETLIFLTKIIKESPDTYKKIFKPEVLNKLNQIVERTQDGRKLGMMDAVTIFSELSSLLK